MGGRIVEMEGFARGFEDEVLLLARDRLLHELQERQRGIEGVDRIAKANEVIAFGDPGRFRKGGLVAIDIDLPAELLRGASLKRPRIKRYCPSPKSNKEVPCSFERMAGVAAVHHDLNRLFEAPASDMELGADFIDLLLRDHHVF
jgi:hypothetical protein